MRQDKNNRDIKNVEEAEKEVKILFQKIKKLKEEGNILDLSSKEDLGIAIMNLISLEEHLFFTYEKTQKDKKYLDLLNEIRNLRKELLAQIVQNPEGEIWCISKHLLAASMRLMEVGTKKLGNNEKKEAENLFHKAYVLWNIFWGLNLNIIDISAVSAKKEDPREISEEGTKLKQKKITVWDKLGNIIKNIMDCCKE